MAKETLAQRVLRLRTEADLTQKALADRVGVTDQTISNIEGGRQKRMRDSTAEEMAKVFRLSVEELLYGPPDIPDMPSIEAVLRQSGEFTGDDLRHVLWAIEGVRARRELAARQGEPSVPYGKAVSWGDLSADVKRTLSRMSLDPDGEAPDEPPEIDPRLKRPRAALDPEDPGEYDAVKDADRDNPP